MDALYFETDVGDPMKPIPAELVGKCSVSLKS